jgi:HAD superfamily hydrolase (TIGR01509 family)
MATEASSPTLSAVIFDLDGVLVDSEIWWDDVREAYAASHGRRWTLDDRAAVMGANSRQWSATMAGRLDLPFGPPAIERAIVDEMVRRYRDLPPPLIPGAVEAVRRLVGTVPLGVASSAHPAVIRSALAATGLAGAFDVVVSSDEVEHGKPEPDVYLEAARRLGVDPARCVVVEDSLNGVLAARSAGMAAVLVPNGSVPPALGAREAANLVLGSIEAFRPEAVLAAAARVR